MKSGAPLAGEWQFAEVVRDGLVVDFVGATDLLRGMKQRVEQRIGRELTHAASGYPPGVPRWRCGPPPTSLKPPGWTARG